MLIHFPLKQTARRACGASTSGAPATTSRRAKSYDAGIRSPSGVIPATAFAYSKKSCEREWDT